MYTKLITESKLLVYIDNYYVVVYVLLVYMSAIRAPVLKAVALSYLCCDTF